jgi:hypothetical protein
MSNPFKANDVVMFSSILEPEDDKDVMVVIELRGDDSVLVEHVLSCPYIHPTSTYRTSDLKLVIRDGVVQ